MNIYLVEDDESIRELVVYTLNASGFAARGFSDAASFDEALRQALPDLMILDIMLPGEDGISILKRLKSKPATQPIPVIMLTAKSAEYDKVTGLDAGADDYISKPFGVMELVSRVRAVLRRSGHNPHSTLSSGPLTLDIMRHHVAIEGQETPLTVKEFELLRSLMEHHGQVLSREQLLDHIWGYSFNGETRTVDVHIRSLRKKLGNAGGLIQTVRGVGYRIG